MKILGLLGLTCVMVGISYSLATLPDLILRVVGWIGVGFFGLGFIALPVMFFRMGPQVIISDEGIEDRRLKVGVIPWEDIRSLSIGSVESTKFICIEVADPERYVSKLPRRSRFLLPVSNAMGFPALTIGFSGLSPGLKEVWAHLEARHPVLGDRLRRPKPAVTAWGGGSEGWAMMRAAALKIAALFSYCGGPLFIADLLKPRLNTGLALLMTFLPVVLMVVGALCLDDASRSRWSLAAVRAGRQGLYMVLGMHAYALWRFVEGVRVPDQSLHYIGIAVGVGWSVAYLRAARRWTSSPEDSSHAGDRPSTEPIEPS